MRNYVQMERLSVVSSLVVYFRLLRFCVTYMYLDLDKFDKASTWDFA